MSGSDSGKQFKARLIAGIVAAAILASLFIGWGLRNSAQYERQADANISHQAQYTRKKIAETCVAVAALEKAECVYEARDKEREYGYNQRDLVAQKRSALWAYVMAVAAVIGMALSALGVWLVKTTFDATRENNDIARSAAKEAADHATATRNAAVLAERAFVEIAKCVLDPPPLDTPDGFMVGFWLKNTGKSPARILRIDYHISEAPFFARKMRRFRRMNNLVGVEKIVALQQFKIRRQPSYPRYLSGVVTYATIYNAEFQTFFCYRLKGALMEDVVGDLVPEMLIFISHPNMPADT